MDSEIIEVSFNVEFHVEWPFYFEVPNIIGVTLTPRIEPQGAHSWLEGRAVQDLVLTEQEEKEMVSFIIRKLTYEVEVEYKTMADGSKRAINGKCQNIGLPKFVEGFLEVEAMKQVEQEGVAHVTAK